MEKKTIKGAEALMCSLIEENVNTIFGYPWRFRSFTIFDAMYSYRDSFQHILNPSRTGGDTCCTGLCQGFRRGTGVVIVTSGPGATNVITGLGRCHA